MDFCYEQYDRDYIRIDFMPQRGGSLRVDVFTRALVYGSIDIRAQQITEKSTYRDTTTFVLLPEQLATLTYNNQICTIRYGEDKKAYLSGNLPIAPYWNGLDPRELEEVNYLIIE